LLNLVLLWKIAIYMFWFRASLATDFQKGEDIAGEYKAILQLADAMRQEFAENSEDTGALSEK
jgi:hypothetical protein